VSSGVGTVEDLAVVSLLGRSGLKARRASGVERRTASKGKTGAVIGVLERERGGDSLR
jgi:hypothetical protein